VPHVSWFSRRGDFLCGATDNVDLSRLTWATRLVHLVRSLPRRQLMTGIRNAKESEETNVTKRQRNRMECSGGRANCRNNPRQGGAPHKWHATIMWTGVAFYGVLIFGRRKWGSWLFWIFWAACLALHGIAMWLIFGQLLPRLVLGTLYVVPLAFVTAIFLIGVFSRLERRLARHSARSNSRGTFAAKD
jgi:hypothetical protein